MDVKKALKAPDAFLASLDVSVSNGVIEQLQELHVEYSATNKAIKAAQKQKGAVASQFKLVKDDSEALACLKTEMQAVSQQLAQLQQELKTVSSKAKQLILPLVEKPEVPLPGQFQPLKKNLQLPITTSVCTAGQQEGLVRFIESLSSESNAYQSMVIPRVIEEAFGHQTVTILAHSQGEIVGALALTIIESSLFGNTATSTPFFNYGGPLTEYKDVAEQLITDSQAILAKQGIENIEIRTTFGGLPFPCSSKKVSMVRALPKSSTELDTQLGSKLRAQINQATEFQPSVKFGGTELLDDFYKVFATNMRDLGTPVYSKKWFLTLLTSASIKTTLVVCYLRGKPVAAGFVFGHNSMLEIPWASTLRRANPMNMNMWMYRQILGFAIEQGYQFFDFGRSTKDASTYKFKKQWGAKPISHYWYYLNRSGKTEGANPDSPKYKLLIAAWKRLPVWLANIIGPPIVKNIP